MRALRIIEEAVNASLCDEEGARVVWSPWPGLTEQGIEALEAEAGCALPGELRELLRWCAGIDGPLTTIDFTGRAFPAVQSPLFPRAITLARDSNGNHWMLDLGALPGPGGEVPVYFACQKATAILYQAESLTTFLEEVLKLYRPPHQSLVAEVYESRLAESFRRAPRTLTVAAAVASDPALRAFAETLDERFTIVDLRRPKIGMGFSWGKLGPQTEVRRHGSLQVFAYGPPPRKSWWRRSG